MINTTPIPSSTPIYHPYPTTSPPTLFLLVTSYPISINLPLPLTFLLPTSNPHHSKVARQTPILVDPVPVLEVPSKMGFCFERMTTSFETIQADFLSNQSQLPSTKRFLAAMNEVNSLFETLGSAFTFVKRDIEKKISIIGQYVALDPHNYSDLNTAINYEIVNRRFDAPQLDDLPNCTRTLLRLMWALRFADCLLEGLGQTFNPHSGLRYTDRTLRWAVSRAYDSTLAAHHSWTIRRSVKGACLLLPTKEAFMDRVGLHLTKREEYITRLAISMSPLVSRMYTFYEKHELLDLP